MFFRFLCFADILTAGGFRFYIVNENIIYKKRVQINLNPS
jgi:hypothetical protein